MRDEGLWKSMLQIAAIILPLRQRDAFAVDGGDKVCMRVKW